MSSPDLFLDLSLVFFLLLVVLNYRAHRSVLYPPFIFSALWLLDLAVVRSSLIELNPVHGNTLAIVAAGAAAFSVGGLLAGLAPQAPLRFHLFPPKAEKTTDLFCNTLMIVLLCGVPLMFYETSELSKLASGGSNVLAQARRSIVEADLSGDSSHSVVLSLISNFMFAAIYASLLFAADKKGRKIWIVTVVALIACILSTGRTGLLILISGLSATRLLQKKQESLGSAVRLLRWPIASFAALFIGLFFTNKDTEEMTGGVASIATRYVLIYISGPLAAFDSVMQHPAEFAMATSHTFMFPLKLAAALHLTNYTSPPVVDSFVTIPFPINVYTVFKFYFLEFGIFGTVALLFFIGLFHSLLYLKARQGGLFSTYLFSCFLWLVLMVTFDDEYYIVGLYLRAISFGLFYFLLRSLQFRLFSAKRQRVLLLANSQ